MAPGFRFAGAAVKRSDVPSWTPFHWMMALAVGSYFAISNFVQNTAIIGGYANLFVFAAALTGFVAVYNIFALTLRAAWRLPPILQKDEGPNLTTISGHALFLIAAGAAQLYAIAILTAMVRTTSHDWPSSIAFYYREITVSCAPIWAIIYVGVFSALRLVTAAHGRETVQTAPVRIEYRQAGVRKYIESASITMIEARGNMRRS